MSSSGATSLNDGHDAEKKAALGSVATPAGTDVSDGNVTSSNPQYERYLDLHRLFQGPARARFIRKREWHASIIISCRAHILMLFGSGLATIADTQFSIPDVFPGQEQRRKRQALWIPRGCGNDFDTI